MDDLIQLANHQFWNSGLPVTSLLFLVVALMLVVFGPPWGND